MPSTTRVRCARGHASVSDQTLTLVQAMRRLRYVMERFGITKRDLHVVLTACVTSSQAVAIH